MIWCEKAASLCSFTSWSCWFLHGCVDAEVVSLSLDDFTAPKCVDHHMCMQLFNSTCRNGGPPARLTCKLVVFHSQCFINFVTHRYIRQSAEPRKVIESNSTTWLLSGQQSKGRINKLRLKILEQLHVFNNLAIVGKSNRYTVFYSERDWDATNGDEVALGLVMRNHPMNSFRSLPWLLSWQQTAWALHPLPAAPMTYSSKWVQIQIWNLAGILTVMGEHVKPTCAVTSWTTIPRSASMPAAAGLEALWTLSQHWTVPVEQDEAGSPPGMGVATARRAMEERTIVSLESIIA